MRIQSTPPQARQTQAPQQNFGKLIFQNATKADATTLSEFALAELNLHFLPYKGIHFINSKQGSNKEKAMLGIFGELKKDRKISEEVTIKSVENLTRKKPK